MLKTTVQYCEHEERRKDCELYPDKFRLELLTDIDMLLMVERSIRDAITQAVKRYARANNKYMKKLYNHISSVLGCKQPLRMGNSSKSTNTWTFMEGCRGLYPDKIDELVKKDKRAYLLEVDVKYPKELHENHNELPFLVDKMKIGREEKLVPSLKRKKGYVVHIKALDQAIKHGLKLKKVHRVMEFRQS